MRADLHIHTFYSDGTMSPKEVVQVAKAKGLEVVAITDHNKIDAWEKLNQEATAAGLIPIKGCEINCKYKGKVLHLLAYGFENTPELMRLIHLSDDEMQLMSDHLVAKLAKDYPQISIADFETYHYDVRKGGWKGLHYMHDRGITQKLFDGFRLYRDYDCDFTSYNFPEIKVLCEAIRKAGGVSVLAHPGEYYKNLEETELKEVLEDLRQQGIDGIECYYPTHSEMMTRTCENFCDEHGLIKTVGSDEHGEFGKHAKVIEQTIGCMNGTITEEVLCKLKSHKSKK